MRSFFDTNVLVYSLDRREPEKAAVAASLFSDCTSRGDAVVSIQVIQEFYSTVTRKFSPPLSYDAARAAVYELTRLDVIEPDIDLVLDAIATSHRYRLAIWDSLIVQAALRGEAKVLYSEDLQDGQVFGSLTVRNPFAA